MRRFTRLLLIVVAVLLLLVGGALAFLFLRYPDVEPAPAVKVAGTAEQVARGAYLANHVTVCMDCHSQRDWSRYSGPPVAGTLGRGGENFGHAMGFPGELHVPNITPAKLAEWSDGEVLRSFTAGVSRDGRPLFPLMPYPIYANLSQPDAEALVAYLRTLPASDNQVPPSTLDFPLNLIVRTMPKNAKLPPETPAPGTPEYGRYMATIAGCRGCHTQERRGVPVAGMELAGGQSFGNVVSANITPDPLTGIGNWRKEDFLRRFNAFDAGAPAVNQGDNNTVMPWTMYAGMSDEDLGAIYDYLRTVPPVRNVVEKWPARAPEKPAAGG